VIAGAFVRPPHGGYPTPTYEQAPLRRRIDSTRLVGHSGAHVPGMAVQSMERAAAGLCVYELPEGGFALWAR
jgi:hypothetical protein